MPVTRREYRNGAAHTPGEGMSQRKEEQMAAAGGGQGMSGGDGLGGVVAWSAADVGAAGMSGGDAGRPKTPIGRARCPCLSLFGLTYQGGRYPVVIRLRTKHRKLKCHAHAG